ncbi:glycosyltransferase family 4 protein [Arenibacterium sp. CAU 1754]
MRRVAFYAPMKPPDHPTPSGDREMARNLMDVIGAGGAVVELASRLRVFDGRGDAAVQARMARDAEGEVARLIAVFLERPIALWVTYHNYYKAPDLIGPAVCAALGVPYVQIESTRARRRLTGDWAGYAAAAEAASDAADVIFYMTDLDRITLERDRTDGQRLVHLPPFLPRDTLPPVARRDASRILSAGMMRPGDKLASYRIIADTLARLETPDWHLDIAGDGAARSEVEAMMTPFGDKVRFLGVLDKDGMAAAYLDAGLFLWPGVNEAFGMVYLEAQAAGLPVLAQDRPGVRDVLAPGDYPAPEAGPAALAKELDRLLGAPEVRRARGDAARAHVAQFHLRGAATETLWSALGPLIGRGS